MQHDHGCPEHAWIHYHVSPYVAVTGHGDILDVGCLLACRSLSLIYDHFSYRNVVDPASRLCTRAPTLVMLSGWSNSADLAVFLRQLDREVSNTRPI